MNNFELINKKKKSLKDSSMSTFSVSSVKIDQDLLSKALCINDSLLHTNENDFNDDHSADLTNYYDDETSGLNNESKSNNTKESNHKTDNIFDRDYLRNITQIDIDEDDHYLAENVHFNEENYFKRKYHDITLTDDDFLAKRFKVGGEDLCLINRIDQKLCAEQDVDNESYLFGGNDDQHGFTTSTFCAPKTAGDRLFDSLDSDLFYTNEIQKSDEDTYNQLNFLNDESSIFDETASKDQASSLFENAGSVNENRIETDPVMNQQSAYSFQFDDHTLDQLTHDKSNLKDIYKVEKLLAKRKKKNGRFEYLVKYENLDDDQVFWESEKTLDSKLVDEFNGKYGDKLLLKDVDRKTYSQYFDKRFSEQDKNIDVDLEVLIRASIKNPLCDVYNNVKPERIIGIYKFEDKYYYLVKWDKLVKADLFECSVFKTRFPEAVIQYYESKMLFCDLEEKLESDAIVESRRVCLTSDQ